MPKSQSIRSSSQIDRNALSQGSEQPEAVRPLLVHRRLINARPGGSHDPGCGNFRGQKKTASDSMSGVIPNP